MPPRPGAAIVAGELFLLCSLLSPRLSHGHEVATSSFATRTEMPWLTTAVAPWPAGALPLGLSVCATARTSHTVLSQFELLQAPPMPKQLGGIPTVHS